MMRAMLVVAVLLVAGCADTSAPAEAQDDGLDVEVDADTGAIRGVVVNDMIVPVAEAMVELTSVDPPRETLTDAEGRFAFSRVQPGTHVLSVSKFGHEPVQAGASVEAGVADAPMVRVQLVRLYSQDPFLVPELFQGYFMCSYNFYVSSTCVNDYTRINPTGHCPGGCLPFLSSLVDNREYVTEVGANWQTILIEMMWDPSLAGTSDTMGMTVSYFGRPNAQHRWEGGSGPSPFDLRLDFATHGGTEAEFHDKIPDTGLEDLFVFMAAGEGQVSIEQDFEIIHHTSYYAPLPEGWSFMNGDEPPF